MRPKPIQERIGKRSASKCVFKPRWTASGEQRNERTVSSKRSIRRYMRPVSTARCILFIVPFFQLEMTLETSQREASSGPEKEEEIDVVGTSDEHVLNGKR